jgi:hypothetical protein
MLPPLGHWLALGYCRSDIVDRETPVRRVISVSLKPTSSGVITRTRLIVYHSDFGCVVEG